MCENFLEFIFTAFILLIDFTNVYFNGFSTSVIKGFHENSS